MALMPKRTVYRSSQRGKMKGIATRGNKLSFGEYGIQALEQCWLSAVQIEAGRIAINRYLKRKGKLWVRVFPNKPVSKRPPETRMGKGKGNPEFWVSVVRPGKILYEVEGAGESEVREAFRRAASKLPIRVRMLKREV
ncbi:MAG: 50S ribosomal protein L16 [uncultured bacterium]|nr:MAG: 50S ribosomal protein L16 [uncultured bacterium]